MSAHNQPAVWWGAPKKFDDRIKERRVSWLELFYDLVYVIAIARITHHFAAHISLHGFYEFTSYFILIFWGWLNGSLYHDIHGNDGLRTRLMTLWQMMIISAIAITLEFSPGLHYKNTIIVFMIMQLFITYLWWSVGFYDPSHRKYNKPYTIFYLVSFLLMGVILLTSDKYIGFLMPAILICNYLPPLLTHRLLSHDSIDLSLSSSMVERLGLFTIIVFGEVVLGVVNGITALPETNSRIWFSFAVAMIIVFSLWWIFFTIVSNRDVRKGFMTATFLELLYIPSLISLILMGACFSWLFKDVNFSYQLQFVFSIALAFFLSCIGMMTILLEFPDNFKKLTPYIRYSLFVTASAFILISILPINIDCIYFLLLTLLFLLLEIGILNYLYYKMVFLKNNTAVN